MKTTLLTLTLIIGSIVYGQQTNESIDIASVNRTYIQYLPSGFDPNTESLPVVFCLHGLGDNAANMANIGLNNMADLERFIPVFPQGLVNQYGQTSWNNGTLLSPNADDVSFIRELIGVMINDYNADYSRIYVCGFSMGGIMSYTLACELNEYIAAIASMSGNMSTNDYNNCAPVYKTPVIHFHGTADGTVPYDSGALPSLTLTPETIDFWKNQHTCANTSDSLRLPDTGSDNLTVDRFIYDNCTAPNSVEFWRINGGDHTYFYEPVSDFTEAIEIWRFFNQWQKSDASQASLFEDNKDDFKIYPNPAIKEMTIELNTSTKGKIVDINGKDLIHFELTSGENSIDISTLSSGIYFVQINDLSKKLFIQ